MIGKKPDYSALDALSVNTAFEDPVALVEAIMGACPSPSYFDENNIEYGTGFDEKISLKLLELAKYSLQRSLKAYTDFDIELFKMALSFESGVVYFYPDQLLKFKESELLGKEDPELFELAKTIVQNAEQQQHLLRIPNLLQSTCRHFICRLRQSLSDEIRRMVNEDKQDFEEEDNEENASEEYSEDSAAEYNVAEGNDEDGFKSFLNFLEENKIKNNLGEDFETSDEFHEIVISDIFLGIVQMMDIFPDSQCATEKDLNYYARIKTPDITPPGP